MRQITGRMSGNEIELEMEIQSLRVRVSALEHRLAELESRLASRDEPAV